MADPSLSVVLRADVSEQLRTLAAIYDMTGKLLRGTLGQPIVEYGGRLWCDLHLEGLGWAFVGGVIALLFTLVPK